MVIALGMILRDRPALIALLEMTGQFRPMPDELPKQNCQLRTEAGGRGGENAENRNSCFFAEMGCLPAFTCFIFGFSLYAGLAKTWLQGQVMVNTHNNQIPAL